MGAGVPSMWPVAHPARAVTSEFGAQRPGGRRHKGLDISAPKGTPVMATAGGVGAFNGRERGYGKIVKIAHPNGIQTWYAHLSASKLKRGKKVRRGQVIGKVGMTGNATGPHLHYEVRVNGVPRNPRPYLP